MAEWDWNKLIESWNFSRAQLDGMSAWDIRNKGTFAERPYYVLFEIVAGKHLSSRNMAIAWDDVFLPYFPANGAFAYRDYTSSSTPFVNDGEKYWSSFTFQYAVDAHEFHAMFGGVCSWEMYEDIKAFEGKMYCESNKLSGYPIRLACPEYDPNLVIEEELRAAKKEIKRLQEILRGIQILAAEDMRMDCGGAYIPQIEADARGGLEQEP